MNEVDAMNGNFNKILAKALDEEHKREHLKKCPFCGGEAFVRKLYSNYIVDAKHDRNCIMANMPLPYDTHWVTQLAAEAAWNRRANDDTD